MKKARKAKGSDVAGGAAETSKPPQKKPAARAAVKWTKLATWKGAVKSAAVAKDLGAEGFCVTSPLAPGCMGTGHSEELAHHDFAAALTAWVETAQRRGMKQPPLPEALYEDRQGNPVYPEKRGRKEKSVWPTPEMCQQAGQKLEKLEKAAFPRGQDENSIAREMLMKKVPRSTSMPAPVHIPASSIFARMKSSLPSAPVVLPRGKTLPKP